MARRIQTQDLQALKSDLFIAYGSQPPSKDVQAMNQEQSEFLRTAEDWGAQKRLEKCIATPTETLSNKQFSLRINIRNSLSVMNFT